MPKEANRHNRKSDRDTMRPEYDFSTSERGVTAARYAQGANTAAIDPEVLDVFLDGATVNRTLRALAPILCLQHRHASNLAQGAVMKQQSMKKAVTPKSCTEWGRVDTLKHDTMDFPDAPELTP
jgi:hypothetical protein